MSKNGITSKKMFRKVFKSGSGFISAILIPTEWFDPHDSVTNKETKTQQNADLSGVQSETGLDRIKRMFMPDEFGELSKELTTVVHVGGMSLFAGGIYGGVLNSRTAYTDFIKNNQHTAFTDHLEAKKKLQDKVTLSFGKGAFKWGWRLSLFCTSFVGISTTISVYRGECGILEYILAGGISGAGYKFSMGPRGWIVGGALGSALGLLCGCSTVCLLKLTGMSMDEVRYWQYHWQKHRTDYVHEGAQKYLEKEEGELYLFHKQRLEEDGSKLNKVDEAKK